MTKRLWTSALLVAGFVSSITGSADNSFSSEKNGMNYSWKAYPSSAKKEEAILLVERVVPKAIRPNKDYTYEVKVTNQSFYKLDQVIITEVLPENFTLIKPFPAPTSRDKVLKWDLGMMAPGQVDVVTVTGKATSPGKIFHRGHAELNSDLGSMTAIMEVVEPVLQFRVIAPSEVILGENIPVKIQFRNGGNAPVLDARLTHSLSRGMTSDTGSNKIVIKVGNIQPNEIKTFDLLLKTKDVGIYENKLIATAKDGVSATAVMKTSVQQPKLKVTAKAPSKRFVGNAIKYTTKIVNTGSATAKNVICRMPIPSGTKFVSADEGGRLEKNVVVWKLGSLQPGEEKAFTSRIIAKKIMVIQTSLRAEALGAAPVVTALVTDVAGIPAILLKMQDINDPVPVGETETYVISVENQGSLAATGIVVKCILEDSMEFVKSVGDVKSKLVGGNVVFETIKKIEPQDVSTLQVVVRAKKEGDVRFTVEINGNELSRPVREAESTNFYE